MSPLHSTFALRALCPTLALLTLYSAFALRAGRTCWPLRKFEFGYLVSHRIPHLRFPLLRLALHHSTYFFVARPASKSCAGREEYYERKSNEEFH